MIRDYDLHKVLKSALREGGEYAEIFFEDALVTSIICEDNRMEKVISGQDTGVGIRLIYNYKTYYAYSNEVTESKMLELAEAVAKGGACGSPVVSKVFCSAIHSSTRPLLTSI